MSIDSWRFKRDGVEEGPVSETQLQAMLSDGTLPPDTPVYADYLGMWTPASQVATFAMRMSGGSSAAMDETPAVASPAFQLQSAPESARPVGEPSAPSAAYQAAPSVGGATTPGEVAAAAPGNGAVDASAPTAVSVSESPTAVSASESPTAVSVSGSPTAPAAFANPAPAISRAPVAAESSSIAARQAAAAAAALQAGAPPPPPPDLQALELKRRYAENPTLVPHPWHRFFARWIDQWWSIIFTVSLCGVFLAAAGAFSPKTDGSATSGDAIVGVLALVGFVFCVFLYLFLEPIMLSVFGTTLGKFLFNIRLRTAEGNKLSFGQAFVRTFMVWVMGGGLANLCPIPVVVTGLVVACFVYQYVQLEKNGSTKWDRDGNFVYEHLPIGVGRWIAIGTLYALPVIGFIALIIVAAVTGKGSSTSD